MNIAYFPFTYLSEPTARKLAAVVGPVAVYQPIEKNVSDELNQLAAQGLVDIRTPMTHDDDRLRAALAEFTEWARLNPGRSTAGMDFLGARQGEVPFFDDTAIQQIRSDFRKYGRAEPPVDEPDDGFSARLFLALAQDNEQAVESLDQDLDRFKILEKEFLEDFDGADEAEFSRQAYGSTLWREDPGSRLTGQRLRAWARLAAADTLLPDVLVTTSPAVIDTLLEYCGDAEGFDRLADLRLDLPDGAGEPVLSRVLEGLVDGSVAPAADSVAEGLRAGGDDGNVRVSLYALAGQPPNAFVEELAVSAPVRAGEATTGHTLVVLVEG
jgi:hypothetical protein